MKNLLNHSKTLVFLLIVVIFSIESCNKESFLQETNAMLINPSLLSEFENMFSLENFEDPGDLILGNLKVDWNNYSVTVIEEQEWYEFETIELRPISYSNSRIEAYNYTLIANKSNDKIKFYVVKMASFGDELKHKYFNIEQDYFHGMSYLYNLKGSIDYIQHYQKGKLINTIEDLLVKDSASSLFGRTGGCEEKANTSAKCDSTSDFSCTIDTGDCGSSGGGKTQIVTTYNWTEWYNKRSDGYMDFSHIQNHATTYEYVWVPTGSVVSGAQYGVNYAIGSYSSSTLNYYTSKPKANYLPIKKITFDDSIKQNPCVLKVAKLLTSTEDQLLRSTIGAFIDDPEYNLVFKVGDCKSDGADACTSPIDSNGNINVTLDNSSVNRPPIEIASLLIHEGIHAEILRFVRKHHTDGTIPDEGMRLFELFDYYSRMFNNKAITHIYMVENYITPMAEALRKLDNNQFPADYYKSLAWDGLRQHDYNNVSTNYDGYRNTVISNSTIKCD